METKIKYIAPIIEIVKLDNEISLALESFPPVREDETNATINLPTNSPFRDSMS